MLTNAAQRACIGQFTASRALSTTISSTRRHFTTVQSPKPTFSSTTTAVAFPQTRFTSVTSSPNPLAITGGFSLAAAATQALPTPVENKTDERTARRIIEDDKRINDRAVLQEDVFKPKGKPPNPIPALAWIIRKDMQDPKKFEVLKEAVSATLHARAAPEYNDQEPQESVRALQSKIIHDMHRVSICLAPIAQNLSMVNNFGQQFNREKKRAIVPIFTLDNLANFQRRLVNRYQRVMDFDYTALSDDEAKDAYDKLKGAEQLCQYDVALMYCVDQSVEMFHPRHPKSFLQQSIRAQADYMIRRRGLIAKKIKEETPDIGEEEFKVEFNKRVALDTQLLNEMLEQRRVDEQKRWAQMQRAQVMRARSQRQEQINQEKKDVFGAEEDHEFDKD